ncbi:MAG: glycosyltransferase, partial [Chloroflexota bacterium]
MRPYRVLTWHVHGGYLESLARTGVEWYLPTRPGGDHGYTGKPPALAEFDNVHDVPVEAVPGLDLDAIVFQNQRNYLEDQHEILTAAQRRLPRLYVEHDPPRANVTDSRHVVDDPDVLLVHVTAFNRLMWDSGATPTVVIDHGMADPGVSWTGELERGVVVINDIATRGRRLGLDLFLEARGLLPLDLVGLRSGAVGGLGEVDHRRLPAFMAGYRFFFHPARYTSLGLAVIEAMLVGLPVVAL